MPGLYEVTLNLTARSGEFNACCLFHFVFPIVWRGVHFLFFFVKTVSLLVLTRYRVNRFTPVPYWSLCGIFYIMSPPAVMSLWGNGRLLSKLYGAILSPFSSVWCWWGEGGFIAHPGTSYCGCLGCSVVFFPEGSLQEVHVVFKREALLCLVTVCY